MKKKLFATFLSLIMVCLFFVGCGVKGGPASSDLVYGNGGLSVRKGDWLFFANGYESQTTLKDGNKNAKGKVEISALYRTKLESDGRVALDDEGNVKDAQLLVSKVVGFEKSGLFIFGNQIYFASPNIAKDKEGEYHFEELTFFKADLNGKNLTSLYTTSAFSETAGKFAFNMINNKVTLVVLDGEKLVKNVGGKTTVLATGVQSAEIAYQKDFDNASKVPALIDTVFFTRTRTIDEGSGIQISGNVFEKVVVSTTERTILHNDADTKFDLKGITNTRIYYTKTNERTPLISGNLFSNSFDAIGSEVQHTAVSNISNIIIFEENLTGAQGGFVFDLNGKKCYSAFNSREIKEVLSDTSTVLRATNNSIYYKDSDGKISILDVTTLNKRVITETAPTKLDNAFHVDFIKDYVYFYFTGENQNGVYLHTIYTGVGDGNESQLVGKAK